MLSIVWAFSSMLVLMLVILWLPLGLTVKGKIFSVSACFFLALGGLAALPLFPLWKTSLLLLLLVLLTAYFMGNRMGSFLFKETSFFEVESKKETAFSTQNSTNTNVLTLGFEDTSLPDITEVKIKDHRLTSDLIEVADFEETYVSEDDISFLLERETNMDVVVEEKKKSELEIGYLSEIESMMDEDFREKPADDIENHQLLDRAVYLDLLEELETNNHSEQRAIELDSHAELELLGNNHNDLLRAQREAAASQEVIVKEKLSLQK